MSKLDLLAAKAVEGCTAYDTESGRCMLSERFCDACYKNSIEQVNQAAVKDGNFYVAALKV